MTLGWEGILDPDEKVLWQGQPEPGVRYEWRKRSKPLFFGMFTIVSIYIVAQLAREGGLQWIFGLPFVLIGLYHLVFIHYWQDYVRRHTHYTVTSKRAIIATDVLGRKTLKSYPLSENTEPELEERNGLTDIYFAEKLRQVLDDRRDGIRGTRTARQQIGFERLRDGRKVYEILRRARAEMQGDAP
jgi:hypothetical protein